MGACPLTASSSTLLTHPSTVLGACHQGAATKGLCLTTERLSDPVQTYTLYNHKVESPSPPNANVIHGLLTYTLRGVGFTTDLIMKFSPVRSDDDLLNPTFSPSGEQYASAVNFDTNGSMHRWENGVKLYNCESIQATLWVLWLLIFQGTCV